MSEVRKIRKQKIKAFTLVELLVVISIIAMLLAILMPSLNRAREQAKGVKCAANAHNVGVAVAAYVAEYYKYPASYLYNSERADPSNKSEYSPNWSIDKQAANRYQGMGYIHWSWFLFDEGRCDASAFECPSVKSKGMPRTNPGPDPQDWEKDQEDMQGNKGSNPSLQDFQAPRVAYAGNGAIMIRNKFKESYYGQQYRFNKFVKGSEVSRPSSVVLACDFTKDYKLLMTSAGQSGSSQIIKSHRPITPFWHESMGADVYSSAFGHFIYQGAGDRDFGIKAEDDLGQEDFIDTPLNGVGRHHPGQYSGNLELPRKKSDYGGSANFMYCDGHVERKHVIETIENAEWGLEFYGITKGYKGGSNMVENPRKSR